FVLFYDDTTTYLLNASYIHSLRTSDLGGPGPSDAASPGGAPPSCATAPAVSAAASASQAVNLPKTRLRSTTTATGPDSLKPFGPDRKSTRLNSSHVSISYSVLCLYI